MTLLPPIAHVPGGGDPVPLAAAPAPASPPLLERILGLPLEQVVSLPAGDIERAYASTRPPEGIRMLLAILHGSLMGPGEGWFGPARSRYSFEWLADLYGIPQGEPIQADQFTGSRALFDRLDRNHDGRIEAADLDWSDDSPSGRPAYLVNRLYRRMDPRGDGRVTRDEWMAFFDQARQGKDHLAFEDLRDTLLADPSVSAMPADAPAKETLIRGLFSGEIGAIEEGPAIGDPAPDFTLKTHDGRETIRLHDLLGKQPIVLVFGNYTCGPFRSMYPGVDEVCRRFRNDALFLSIYVREAHPTDGWHMGSNDRVGVITAQPKTYGERVVVATRCHDLLQPSMPLLVDDIHDPTGHAYSGMPARLYVIDRDGKVAYQGGRGPFGFKAGEMEQALVMALLEQSSR